jgi:Rho-binding antiterminator
MEPYNPVNCDFHDELEALATLRQPCRLVYRNQNDQQAEIQGQIVDVYASHGADFLKLEDGTEIRLDRVISVDK